MTMAPVPELWFKGNVKRYYPDSILFVIVLVFFSYIGHFEDYFYGDVITIILRPGNGIDLVDLSYELVKEGNSYITYSKYLNKYFILISGMWCHI